MFRLNDGFLREVIDKSINPIITAFGILFNDSCFTNQEFIDHFLKIIIA